MKFLKFLLPLLIPVFGFGQSGDKISDLVFERINSHRESLGLSPVTISKVNLEIAKKNCLKNKFVEGGQTFGHTPQSELDLSLDKRKMFGENITSFGINLRSDDQDLQDKIADRIFSNWINSPEHRKNIESPNFIWIGVYCDIQSKPQGVEGWYHYLVSATMFMSN